MILNEFERDQEGSGGRGTKPSAREWGRRAADRWGRLRDLFAQVQARYVLLQGSCLGDFAKISGRPAWFKPPGLLFFPNSSEFF